MKDDNRILFVDDEPFVLTALQRRLKTTFNIELAPSARQALHVLANDGPFAVVISDYKMPEMNGVQFLAEVKAAFPDTVRVMLTGEADLNAAIAAVNDGYIFRFLTKPCPSTVLVSALEAALDQHRLIMAERDLLHKTLMGAVTVLNEILCVVYPPAFSSSFRIQRYVAALANTFGMRDVWQLEVAGILSQIGCITLPLPRSIQAHSTDLSDDNSHLFLRHAAAAANFLRRIPRLEITAEIVALQHKPFQEYDVETKGVDGHLVAMGGQMLHVAVNLERLIRRGSTFPDAIEEMRGWKGEYNPTLLDALTDVDDCQWVTRTVTTADLDTSMLPNEDILTTSGSVLVAKGARLTCPLLERIRSFASAVGLREPFEVVVPRPLTDITTRPRVLAAAFPDAARTDEIRPTPGDELTSPLRI